MALNRNNRQKARSAFFGNNSGLETSKYSCSPDNAAAEGFFGRLKQEFFHKRSFAGVSMDGFINMLDGYMVWYRDKRIKTEFGHGHHGSSTRARLVA